MTKRFSRLKYALRAIQDPTSDGTANQPPNGSILENYTEFASGSRQVSYPRDANSLPGEFTPIGVNPFGLPDNASNIVRTGISDRVLTANAISTVRTAANIETDAELAVLELRGFVPAKAVVFIADATQPTQPETSQITGLKYKKRAGVSYTIPYGQNTGAVHESVVRGNIIAAVESIDRASVSFKSEKL